MDKIKAHLVKCSNALLKVRPLGGSELFIRVDEEFYADPDYCGRCIDTLRADLDMARREIIELKRSAKQ
jgi:hypothetical protein